MCSQVEFFPCPQNQVDPLNACNFIWLQLGITADDHHECVGVALHRSAHGVATFRVSVVGDTARVDHDHVGCIVDVHPRIPGLGQLFGQGGCFAEIQLAPQGVKGCFETVAMGAKVHLVLGCNLVKGCRVNLPNLLMLSVVK